MPRKYVKMEALTDEVFRRKAAGETNREIGESYGLSKEQITRLVTRQNRKRRLIANGYTPLPKGRPSKNETSEAQRQRNEIAKLKMQVEVLQNFLYEAGRR